MDNFLQIEFNCLLQNENVTKMKRFRASLTKHCVQQKKIIPKSVYKCLRYRSINTKRKLQTTRNCEPFLKFFDLSKVITWKLSL